ncbi:MAG: ATP-binding protein [Cytophagales bacterium]|nr:ATP-binding protein [Cytophagales bacterium]
MVFKNFKVQLVTRVALLIGTIYVFTNLANSDAYTFTQGLFLVLILGQVYYLYQFLNKVNRELVTFLKSIHYDDFSLTYPERATKSSMDLVYREFNSVIKKFREIRAEKEAQYTYLKTIVQHVGIGIITVDKIGEIQIINTAARTLLGIKQMKNISQIRSVSPALVDAMESMKTGGRDLIKINREGDEVQLAIYVIELSLRGKEFKLISLQNIQSELEEKEMEAWQNLIRVLTHEIMNSVTPISSLAATVEDELSGYLDNEGDVNPISNEEVEDFHLALQTIHNRSVSLIKFVSDFRNMTRVKLPTIEEHKVCDILKHVISLLKNDMKEQGIELDYHVEPEELLFNVDKEQIEQVVINLVKNAIQALAENEEDGKENKLLKIRANQGDENAVLITINDNGPGIEEEALKKIFIPFFTTKKNGSGIGLSLSKQIMRNHRGNISAKSVLNVGTEFTLKFQN